MIAGTLAIGATALHFRFLTGEMTPRSLDRDRIYAVQKLKEKRHEVDAEMGMGIKAEQSNRLEQERCESFK